MAAPGEKPFISGGRKIDGWQKGAGEVWTTTVPQVRDGKWYFRQLFVNGHRAIRARTPNLTEKAPFWTIATSTERPGVVPQADATIVLGMDHELGHWSNIEDVEIVWVLNNDCSRMRIGAADPAKRTVSLFPPHAFLPQRLPGEYQPGLPYPGPHAYFENAIEMLDEPGEWYLDRKSGVLSYWPRPGEDMTHADVVAPVMAEMLLHIAGTADHPIQNLHFSGLGVEYNDWPLPKSGYIADFGCLLLKLDASGPGMQFVFMDSAVQFENARKCSFEDGSIEHVGAMGLNLGAGTSDILVRGNRIAETGAGGICGGATRNRDCLPWSPVPKEDEYKSYRILDNYIADVGLDYFGAIGIFLGQTQEALIAHNLIRDTAYCGIVISGNEDHSTFSKNNDVEFNEIHDVMKFAGDGAGIYISFPMSGHGANIRGNLIYDVWPNIYHVSWGQAGLYLDLSTENFHFENNIIYQARQSWGTGKPLNVNASASEKSTWKDNLFLNTGQPPADVLAAARSTAGLEAAYRKRLGD